jgi:hypothetical protein
MWKLATATSLATVYILTTSSSDATENNYNYCQSSPLRSDALDFPSKHAWDLFVNINHPAINEAISRGVPDCSKPIGTPGTTTVWETWRNAGHPSEDVSENIPGEVFMTDGSEPPEWNDNTKPDEKPGSVPVGSRTANTSVLSKDARGPTLLDKISFHDIAFLDSIKIQFSEDGVYTGGGGFGETRMNRSTYDFIKLNCLWSSDGLKRYAQANHSGKKPPIVFPTDSMEVKAAWIGFDENNVSPEMQKTFYTADYKGKKYGLVAIHILTKDVPKWFWATFHHKNQTGLTKPEGRIPFRPGMEIEDTYKQPAILKNTVWENYVLGGTQTDFNTSLGAPTILSDAHIEKGFVRSSCISCHSTATISPDDNPPVPNQPRAICALSAGQNDIGLTTKVCKERIGEKYFRTKSADEDELITESGAPFPEWFAKNGNPTYYLQTDFLYSMTFRAAPEKTAPPARCIW